MLVRVHIESASIKGLLGKDDTQYPPPTAIACRLSEGRRYHLTLLFKLVWPNHLRLLTTGREDFRQVNNASYGFKRVTENTDREFVYGSSAN